MSCSKKVLNKCLLVNDNLFLLHAFSATLNLHFDFVEKAQNGREACEKVMSHERNYYKAIILDINMPIMDGMEACIKIKNYLNEKEVEALGKETQTIPFVYALTSESDDNFVARIK